MMEDKMRALPFIFSLVLGLPAMAQDAQQGEAIFGYYCATCHGSDATGTGLVSHGSMMPVYGDFFAGTDVMTKTEAGQPVLTSQPIVDLLAYLERLQQK
jgi:mono/diheme cytochrome c family protein